MYRFVKIKHLFDPLKNETINDVDCKCCALLKLLQ